MDGGSPVIAPKMSLKHDVRTTGIRPEIVLALSAAAMVWARHGFELVVTSLVDGKHRLGSLHYAGAAADLRTRDMPLAVAAAATEELGECLGPDFDVVLEANPPHCHVEWQPKG